MRLIDTASGLIRLSIKRLRSDVWLSIGLMIGLVVASMLTVSVPMYTEAANNRLLQQEMVSVDRTLRIPYMFRAINSSGDLGDAQISLADRVLTEQAPGLVGLPLEITGFTVQSDFFGLYAADDESAYASRRDDLGRFKLGAVRDFQDHVTLVEGRWPAEHDPAMGGALEVLVSETARPGFRLARTMWCSAGLRPRWRSIRSRCGWLASGGPTIRPAPIGSSLPRSMMGCC